MSFTLPNLNLMSMRLPYLPKAQMPSPYPAQSGGLLSASQAPRLPRNPVDTDAAFKLPEFGFNAPAFPTFNSSDPFNQAPQIDIGTILRLIQTPQQSLTNLAIPSLQNILGQQGPAIAPQIQAVRQRGEELAAQAQSDAMKRGLTGSDIEASGMLGARQGAAQQEAELRGQVALQQAQTMAQAVMQALGFDIAQNKEMFLNLAQAIGQELTAQRDMEMFQKQIDLGNKQIKQARENAIIKEIADAVKKILGG